MSAVIADTHTILWYLSDDENLSVGAANALDSACATGDAILIPTICIVEAVYLVEKRRVGRDALDRLTGILRDDNVACYSVPLTIDIAEALRNISRAAVPDLPDRVIAATALARDLPLVTRDQRIRALPIATIW